MISNSLGAMPRGVYDALREYADTWATRGVRAWESIAIAEYCAEQKPGLWPAEAAARAQARSVAAEMHAGFRGLRQAMPMNLGREFPGGGRTPEALADIARIEAIWAKRSPPPAAPSCSGAPSAWRTRCSRRW